MFKKELKANEIKVRNKTIIGLKFNFFMYSNSFSMKLEIRL